MDRIYRCCIGASNLWNVTEPLKYPRKLGPPQVFIVPKGLPPMQSEPLHPEVFTKHLRSFGASGYYKNMTL